MRWRDHFQCMHVEFSIILPKTELNCSHQPEHIMRKGKLFKLTVATNTNWASTYMIRVEQFGDPIRCSWPRVARKAYVCPQSAPILVRDCCDFSHNKPLDILRSSDTWQKHSKIRSNKMSIPSTPDEIEAGGQCGEKRRRNSHKGSKY